MAAVTRICVTGGSQQCSEVWLLNRLHDISVTKLENSGGTCLLAGSPCSLCTGYISTMPLADGRVAVNMHSYGLSGKAVGKEIH